eukprot:TRINITY_DN5006_c0_g1_i1.p1 TRINITY_DN5006_c0_g1~~TRINITY_DN5006_c0_g1_i1.p1  ORF type:complete len:442 (+),score=62.11 TRINITY_DN5006_c0_g1_i1:73-1398(+)
MKKFTKCTFMIAAVVSTLLFCVYKLRYDRLYHVMQVLEVFGTPSDFHSCERKNEDIDLVPPTWLQLEPGVQVYSGQCVKLPGEDGACPQVDVLAIIKENPDIDSLLCKFWIEGSTQPILGTFSHRVLMTEKGHSSAFLSCQSKYVTKVPFGISFFRKQEESPAVIPVSSVPDLPVNSPTILTCIRPTSGSLMAPSMLTESILFHSMIGITRFILYANVLPHSFQSIVAKLEIKTQVQVQVRPWHLSTEVSANIENSLLDQDCYAQSKLHALHYILLRENQILMPATGSNLTQTLNASLLEPGPNQLKVRRFCSEYPNDKKTAYLTRPVSILQSTYYHKNMSANVTRNLVRRGGVTVGGKSAPPANKQTVSPPLPSKFARNAGVVVDAGGSSIASKMFINEYGSCDRYDFSENDATAVYEAGALRFSNSLPAFMKKYGYIVD